VVSCPNYPSLQNYAVLDWPKTTSFCPKRRSFRHFRFYFYFYFFFEKKKEIKKKKKKKGNRVAGATPFLAKGSLRPPHTGRMGVAEPTPYLWGWSGQPERPPRTKKKKKGLGFWGWPDHPQGLGGGFGHPLQPVGGGRSHPFLG
jgi:hypothetical protein